MLLPLFPLAQVILVNFQYRFKNYGRYVTKWEFPLVKYTAVALHPYAIINQDSDQVNLTAMYVIVWVLIYAFTFAVQVQRVY